MCSIYKPATQEAFEKREEPYNQIPPVEVLSKTVKGVRELSQEAFCQFRESGELPCKRRKQGEGRRFLTIGGKNSSISFLIHARTNCRAGGLLNMTNEELDSVNTDIRRTHKHKTGHIMTNFCKLSEENLEWLTTFHEIYEQMQGRVAILAFSNDDDCKLTAQATTINTITGQNFDLKAYNFGPNSIRKHWDTMQEKKNLLQRTYAPPMGLTVAFQKLQGRNFTSSPSRMMKLSEFCLCKKKFGRSGIFKEVKRATSCPGLFSLATK